MRRRKIFWQLYLPFLILAFLSLLLSIYYVANFWRRIYLNQLTADLGRLVQLAAVELSAGLPAQPEVLVAKVEDWSRASGVRFTVIAIDGRVLADSAEDANQMENHADRPEFRQALSTGVGQVRRQSPTLKENLLYYAVTFRSPTGPAGVVRVALPIAYIDQILTDIYFRIIMVGLGMAVLVAVAGLVVVRRFNQPLSRIIAGAQNFALGNLQEKLPRTGIEELDRLTVALNNMAQQLQERFRTILRQRQEQEAILASMSEGVLAVDDQDRIITLNRAAGKLLQVDPQSVRQQPVNEFIRNQELLNFLAATREALEPTEREIKLNGLRECYLQVHGSKLVDQAGTVFGVLLVLNDVTRLRRLEQVRRDFVANVSHELRTPVTSIKGFVETLQGGAEPEEARYFLEIIARQADRLHNIIEDLLTLSRLEQGEEDGVFRLEDQEVKPVLAAAIEVCAWRAAEKNITLSLDCPDDLRARIDPPLLEQAVVNLIDNAVKYSPEGTRVRVEGKVEDQELLIRVIDQGPGIPIQHWARIFERFYRVDQSRSRKDGGTGLGLAIVKHIAQIHGGKVTVASVPGHGSTFTIHLPKPQS